MKESCMASGSVMAGGYREKVQDILSQSLEQCLSFINRDCRDRGSRLCNFDDVEVCLGSCLEGGVSISLSGIRNFQVEEGFVETIWDTISLIAVLPHLQKMNRGSTVSLCSPDSCL